MILDSIDPSAGRLRVTCGAGPARDEQRDVCFTGWLGLLRALYLVLVAAKEPVGGGYAGGRWPARGAGGCERLLHINLPHPARGGNDDRVGRQPAPATATRTGRARCWSRRWRSTSSGRRAGPGPRRGGAAPGRPAPRSRGGAAGRQFGWASPFTPAEQAVARLVADGLTNPRIGARLYISRRTVQTHLVHIFAKIDIASRAQLAAQVARYRQ